MSHESIGEEAGSAWSRPMRARGTDEAHRVSTPLELFVDLCFVVAVAQASARLHHALVEGHLAQALLGYPMVFFAIWWAWMNFTWFASAYDTDDVPYRVAVLVQIVGVLILAAGVPRAFELGDFGVVTLGYAVMRLALVGQWLRAARADPERALTATRYAVGIAACMMGWVLLLLLPARWRLVAWAVMVPAELLVPVWAERAAATTWHPHHIAERYGLLTLIVLGESVLATTLAIQSALDAGHGLGHLLSIAAGALLIVFAMWWLYFAQPTADLVARHRSTFGIVPHDSFVWGYGHYVVFASAAAVGAGLATVVAQATGHAALSSRGATAAVAVPVALYLLSLWLLDAKGRRSGWPRRAALPGTAVLVLAAAAGGLPVVAIGALVVLCVAMSLVAAQSPTVAAP